MKTHKFLIIMILNLFIAPINFAHCMNAEDAQSILKAGSISLNSLEKSFPRADITKLQVEINKDFARIEVPIASTEEEVNDGIKRSVGYNLNYMIPFMHGIYRTVPDKDVLEIGAGIGITSGRLIAAKPKSLYTIELSSEAWKLSKDVTDRYRKTCPEGQPYMQIGATRRVCGDILTYQLKAASYDTVLLLNVLHYMTPNEGLTTLNNIKPSLKNEASRLFITVNMPFTTDLMNDAAEHCFNRYKKGLDEHKDYPGYMYYETSEIYSMTKKGSKWGAPVNILNNSVVECHHLDPQDNSSPTQIFNGGEFDSSTGQGKNSAIIPVFWFDESTIRSMLDRAGYDVESLYMQAEDGSIHEHITYEELFEKHKKKIHMSVHVVAKIRSEKLEA